MSDAVAQLVGGRWTPGSSTTDEPIPDPATGETIAVLRYSGPDDLDAAVGAARAAQPAWGDTPVPDRAQVMFRFKALLEAHADELAQLVVHENGKTLPEARGEVRRGIEVVDFACGAPTLLMGTNLDQIASGIDTELTRFPVGVVAGITPFNFPAMVPLWMAPISIVCGNAFILKPSERTPLSAVRLVELLTEAGLPEGVCNLVHGGRDVVEALLSHSGIDAISFVGSAGVARAVYQGAAAYGKRVQALGGAKNHLLVLDDAELEPSVTALISSAFGNAGQRCLAGSVAVGVGTVGDALVDELARQASALTLGPGIDPATDMGPVIRDTQRSKLHDAIDAGTAAGARLVTDGRGAGPSAGFFLGPTIFDDVTPDMDLWRTELFGPVLSVLRADDLDVAINVLNSSSFGNQASIFTQSGGAAREFRRRAEAGMIGVNIGVAAPMAFFPFTGWKNSFLGDLHATGADGVRFNTRQKVVTSRWSLPRNLDHSIPEGRGH
jgi:malonate-semialdehyde dehydrogenase (acetylating)/methylmalonate-semialdehyde dehydrogenase